MALTSLFESPLQAERITIIASRTTVLMSKVYYQSVVCSMLILVALVDFKKRFIDVEVGWPGSVGDARIFESSYLSRNYREYLQQFGTTPLLTGVDAAGNPILEDVPAFILGDSAYRNTREFVTTYKLNECDRSRFVAVLNRRLGRARYHVENAFGILKGRFQLLSRPLLSGSEDLPFTVHLIAAIFVLHNFLIDSRDELPEVDENHVVAAPSVDDVEVEGRGNIHPVGEVETTRDILL